MNPLGVGLDLNQDSRLGWKGVNGRGDLEIDQFHYKRNASLGPREVGSRANAGFLLGTTGHGFHDTFSPRRLSRCVPPLQTTRYGE